MSLFERVGEEGHWVTIRGKPVFVSGDAPSTKPVVPCGDRMSSGRRQRAQALDTAASTADTVSRLSGSLAAHLKCRDQEKVKQTISQIGKQLASVKKMTGDAKSKAAFDDEKRLMRGESLFDRVVNLGEAWDEKLHPRDPFGRFGTGDVGVRDAVRQASATLAPVDQAKALTARMRSGELSSERVQAAAMLGHPTAQLLFPDVGPDDFWSADAVKSLGADIAHFAVPVAERALELFDPLDRASRATPDDLEEFTKAAFQAARKYSADKSEESLRAANAAGMKAWSALRHREETRGDSDTPWESQASRVVMAACSALLGVGKDHFSDLITAETAKRYGWSPKDVGLDKKERDPSDVAFYLTKSAEEAHGRKAEADAEGHVEPDWDSFAERRRRLTRARDDAREDAEKDEANAQKAALAAILVPSVSTEAVSLFDRVVESWDEKRHPRDTAGRFSGGPAAPEDDDEEDEEDDSYRRARLDKEADEDAEWEREDDARRAAERAKIAKMGPLTAENAVGLHLQHVEVDDLASLVKHGLAFELDPDPWNPGSNESFLLTRTLSNDKIAAQTGQDPKDFPWRLTVIETSKGKDRPRGHGLYQSVKGALKELLDSPYFDRLKISAVEWSDEQASAVAKWLVETTDPSAVWTAEDWNEKLHPRDDSGRFGDVGRRAAARKASLTGAPEDQAKVLSDRMRSGLISPEQVQLAARLGHPAARLLMPKEPEVELGDPVANRTALELLDPESQVKWALDVANHMYAGVAKKEDNPPEHEDALALAGGLLRRVGEYLDRKKREPDNRRALSAMRDDLEERIQELDRTDVYPFNTPSYRAVKAVKNAAMSATALRLHTTFASLTLPGRGVDKATVAWGRERLLHYASVESAPVNETSDLPSAYGITRPMTTRTGLGSSPDAPALMRFGRRPLRISLKK